jgi:F0F1-type ATP synthase membrane subunit b/b'
VTLLHTNLQHPGVAHAPKRAVFALLRTQVCGKIQGVHMSVNAARMSACATLGLVFAGCLLAQGGGQEAEPSDPWLGWKWANFAILALGLGYLIRKHAPGFFRQRSQDIQQGIVEAAQVKKDAEARAAEIDRRLAGLEGEIAGLRAGAKAEIAAEGERIGRETEQRLKRIETQSAQEVALMARNARAELRKFSAQLALDLAQQRIGSRMTKDAQDGLVDGFLRDLRSQVTQDARS